MAIEVARVNVPNETRILIAEKSRRIGTGMRKTFVTVIVTTDTGVIREIFSKTFLVDFPFALYQVVCVRNAVKGTSRRERRSLEERLHISVGGERRKKDENIERTHCASLNRENIR